MNQLTDHTSFIFIMSMYQNIMSELTPTFGQTTLISTHDLNVLKHVGVDKLNLIVKYASIFGHLNILQSIFELVGNQSWWNECNSSAAMFGHLNIIKWLDSIGFSDIGLVCVLSSAFKQLHIVQWAFMQHHCPELKSFYFVQRQEQFYTASRWLERHKPSTYSIATDWLDAIDYELESIATLHPDLAGTIKHYI